MTWYPDLSEYTYISESIPDGGTILTVGWLDSGHEFPTGEVPQEFVDAIAEQSANYGFARTRGWHSCGLTHPEDPGYPITVEIHGREVSLGSAEIRFTTEDGTILTAPNLIYHYITAHHYRPPEEFIQAVLKRRTPPTVTPSYDDRQVREWHVARGTPITGDEK